MSLTLTDNAKQRMLSILETSSETTVLLGTNSKGCGGNGYVMGIIDSSEIEADDLVIALDKGKQVVVPSQSLGLLEGTVVDWVEDSLSGRFVFDNPNARSSCGCGDSFSTGAPTDDVGGGCGS